jgi:hypothetical protein
VFICDFQGFAFAFAISNLKDRSLDNGSQLAVAAPLHVVLDLRGQGGEIALTAVISNNDEPM